MCGNSNPLNHHAIEMQAAAISAGSLALDAANRPFRNWLVDSVAAATLSFANFLEGGIYRIHIKATTPAATWTLPAGAVFVPGSTGTISVSWTGADTRILRITVIDGLYYLSWETVAQTAAFTGDLNGGTLTDFVADINAQTGTTYTLVAADSGRVITFNNAAAITVTVPLGLPVGFNCTLEQIGAGQVTIVGPDVTIRNRQSHTKIAGQYGVAGLISHVANTFILAGDTSA